MKKTLSILLMMTVVLMGALALDIVIPRDYAASGFTLRLEGKPDFIVDSTIWKANSLGVRISSITKHAWEISDSDMRTIVVLGADSNDMRAVEKHLDRNAEGLTLFIGLDTDIPGSFFMNYRFETVAMQSYTPEVMRALRATRTQYYPVKFTDVIRIGEGTVDFINEKDLGSKSIEVKTKEAAPAEAPAPAEPATEEGRTIIVICPHCGEQITIKI